MEMSFAAQNFSSESIGSDPGDKMNTSGVKHVESL
jgi:hypothetical protein